MCNKDTTLGDFLYRAVEPMGVDPGGDFGRGGCYLKYPPQIFDRASLAF